MSPRCPRGDPRVRRRRRSLDGAVLTADEGADVAKGLQPGPVQQPLTDLLRNRLATVKLYCQGKALLATAIRAKEFVSIGSAIGANSLANRHKHVSAAEAAGLSAAEIAAAIAVARVVQRHTASVTADGIIAPIPGGVPRPARSQPG